MRANIKKGEDTFMRLSLSIVIVTIMTTIIGCQNPGFLGLQERAHYQDLPVAGPGPGVTSPPQSPMYQLPLAPPGHANPQTGAVTPSMYYPMTLRYDSPVNEIGTGGALPNPTPNPVIPSPALGNISAAAATPSQNNAPGTTSQVSFESPEALIIHYDAKIPGAFDSEPLICPAIHEFAHGNVYRLKLSNIPGRPGKELYPTLEVAPTNSRTLAYLLHCPVPISFSDNDFDQVISGNLITKVIYLPNREYQSLSSAGIGTIVNTDLEPGVDPINEAQNRGSILAIIRMGNKDLRLTENELKRRAAVVASMPPGVPPQVAIPSEQIYSSITGVPISGRNIPSYGTPITKTTTGVPGPPQLPVAMDSGYRHPIIYAEPIPMPPSVRAYPSPTGTTPYGYPTPTNIPYNFQSPTNFQPPTTYFAPPVAPNQPVLMANPRVR
jgi:hypothetical protein